MRNSRAEDVGPAGADEREKAGAGGETSAPGPSVWPAVLEATLSARGGRTVVEKSFFRGPLLIQRPFYPEKEPPGSGRGKPARARPAHLYVLHPPGGLVGGDSLDVRLTLKDGAHALVTSPSGAKIYKVRGDGLPQTSLASARLGEGAVLEWLPAPTIVFSGAGARLGFDLSLAPGARALGCETTILGRPVSGMAFEEGYLRQTLRVSRGGRLLFRDLLVVRGGSDQLASPFSLAGQNASAVFWAVGRAGDEDDLKALNGARDALACFCRDGGELADGRGRDGEGGRRGPEASRTARWSATVRKGVFLARALTSTQQQAEDFREVVWRTLRPAFLGREARSPGIWAT
jgi:urease accessory protein